MNLINTDIMRQPANWLIVALMVAIGTWGLHLIMGGAQAQNAGFVLPNAGVPPL